MANYSSLGRDGRRGPRVTSKVHSLLCLRSLGCRADCPNTWGPSRDFFLRVHAGRSLHCLLWHMGSLQVRLKRLVKQPRYAVGAHGRNLTARELYDKGDDTSSVLCFSKADHTALLCTSRDCNQCGEHSSGGIEYPCSSTLTRPAPAVSRCSVNCSGLGPDTLQAASL